MRDAIRKWAYCFAGARASLLPGGTRCAALLLAHVAWLATRCTAPAVQEMASRGLAAVYDMADEATRKALLDSLVATLSGVAPLFGQEPAVSNQGGTRLCQPACKARKLRQPCQGVPRPQRLPCTARLEFLHACVLGVLPAGRRPGSLQLPLLLTLPHTLLPTSHPQHHRRPPEAARRQAERRQQAV